MIAYVKATTRRMMRRQRLELGRWDVGKLKESGANGMIPCGDAGMSPDVFPSS